MSSDISEQEEVLCHLPAVPSMEIGEGKASREMCRRQERSLAHGKGSGGASKVGSTSPTPAAPPSDLWVMSTPPPITCPDTGPTRHHCRTIPWRGKFITGQTPKCIEERKIQNYCAGPERGAGQHQQDRDPGAPAMVTNEHWYYQCTAGQRLFVNAGMTQPEPQQRLCSWYILCIADKSLENKSTDLTTKEEFNADSDCKSRKHPGEILSFDGCKKIIVQPFLNHIERDLKDLKEESR